MSLQSKCCQEPSWSEGLMVTDPSMVAHSHDNKLCWTLGSSHLFMPHELHMTIFTQFPLGLWSKREQQKLEHFLIMKYYLHNVLLATRVNLERNNTRDLTFLFWQELPIKCYCSRLHNPEPPSLELPFLLHPCPQTRSSKNSEAIFLLSPRLLISTST